MSNLFGKLSWESVKLSLFSIRFQSLTASETFCCSLNLKILPVKILQWSKGHSFQRKDTQSFKSKYVLFGRTICSSFFQMCSWPIKTWKLLFFFCVVAFGCLWLALSSVRYCARCRVCEDIFPEETLSASEKKWDAGIDLLY